jgi:hypothetical protein
VIAGEVVSGMAMAIGSEDRVLKQWHARAEKIERDILLVYNGMPFLSALVELVEQNASIWTRSGVVGPYANPDHRTSMSVSLADPQLPESIRKYDEICRSVEGGFAAEYMRRINPHAVVTRAPGYDLLRYTEGAYFKEHVDAVKDHPELSGRRLAVVAFANDNFEGGELVFTRHDITVKPEP